MSRDVCGICWCPYEDDGKCGCKPAQPEALMIADRLDVWGDQGDLLEASAVLRKQHALLRQALEALEACLGWPHVIEAIKERLK